MIIKSKGMSIKAIGNVLEYILRSDAQLKDGAGKTLLIKQNLRGAEPKDWAREYLTNESKRISKNKRARGFYHCIISLHPKDSVHVTTDMLEKIARQFIRLRCPDSLVVATAHQDEHIHLHLAISSVAYGSGKSIRMDKSEFAEMLREMERYQEREFGQLQFSMVDFGNKKD
jgi:hypothetical protein